MPASDTNESVLRFESVSLSFEGNKALDNISFDLKRGQTLIVFGAAGTGKSVMLKVAIGLLQADTGRVFLFGQDITRLSEHELYPLRAKVGVLFQEGGLFDSMTVSENVSYPLMTAAMMKGDKASMNGDIPTRVREALRFVELEQTLEKFPSELSGGMRRRVGIARATITEPALMLYDSPTAGLDPITANTIIALIVKARDTKNSTPVIVSHRYQDGHMMANFRYNPQSDRVEPIPKDERAGRQKTIFMVFEGGRIAFQGSQMELENATDPYVSKFKSVKT
jgi:phospholipid/cholesterol/gamma-HCH transport system ATP-binding protein